MTAHDLRRPATIALCALAVLPSCDGAGDRVAAGAERTRAEAAGVDVRVVVEGVAGAPDVTLEGAGAFDFARRRGRIAFGVEAARGAPAQRFEAVYDGGRAYVRAPFLSTPGARPWLALDVDDALAQHEAGVLTIVARSDPAVVLGVLDELRDEAVEEGEGSLAGADATRYRVSAAPPYGDADVAVDVWLDERERVRRVHYTTTVLVPAVAGGEIQQDVATTLTLTSFGAVPQVRVPPPSRTADAERALDAVGAEGD
ncbi:MAG TPA: hypothetical protein VHJ34_09925 [Actinomycetota bacterium]|nr:hypothetical protein [Actinomycetota bacterium]